MATAYGAGVSIEHNHLGQPIGVLVDRELPDVAPSAAPFAGSHCDVVRLQSDQHVGALHEAFAASRDIREWTYLPYGPFATEADFQAWASTYDGSTDPLFFAVLDQVGPCGIASYLRIAPASGSIEVGHIHFAARLQRTRAGTEAMFLMMQRVFAAGYRRYEWKCDALNMPSRQAAQRLGFTFEGVFRQAAVVKGRNRDTAWFSIVDSEWPRLEAEFLRWLDPANFDQAGRQFTPLRHGQ